MKLSEELSFDGDEGEPGYWLERDGLIGNYPWIYVDFKVSGVHSLQNLKTVEDEIRAACEAHVPAASYLSTTITANQLGTRLRCRLIYREDLDHR